MAYFNKSALEISKVLDNKQAPIDIFLDTFDSNEKEKFFDIGSIIEICGDSGTGKTQMCMQLAVNSTIPKILGGNEGQVIYIDTDANFYRKRILEIYRGTQEWLNNQKWVFGKSVHYFEAQHYEELATIIIYLQDHLEKDYSNVNLIIIDSFSAVFKQFDDFGKIVRLQQELFLEISRIKSKFNITVVLTTSGEIKSFLLEMYSHNVDKRIILKRINDHNLFGFVHKSVTGTTPISTFKITKDGLRDSI